MDYQVNSDHNGAVMIGDRAYHATQIIKDDGSSPRVTKAIERLLELEKPPITAVTQTTADTPPGVPPENPKSKSLDSGKKADAL